MARRRRPGLRKRGDTWHIEKFINGHRIYESTERQHIDGLRRTTTAASKISVKS